MSELTEKVAWEHMLSWDTRMLDEVEGQCGCGRYFVSRLMHAEHVAEVTEAATRAAVAADIRALADEMRQSVDPLGADPDQLSYINCTYIDASMVDSLAARIAEGKQP